MNAQISAAPVLAASLGAAEAWMLVTVGVLLVLLAFLAVAETSINRISVVKAQSLLDAQRRGARALNDLVREPERWLNPVILAVNVAATVQAVLTGIVADRLFGPVGVLIGTLLNVVVFFILTEALPKTWAVLNPERAALVTARPVTWLVKFWPLRVVSRMFIWITNVIVKGKGLEQGPFVSEKELLGIVQTAAEEEVIEHEERELIESIIEFGDTVVREVMVPRTDMVTVDHDDTVNDALAEAIEHGFSRMPVLGAGIDDIVGVVYSKDLMRAERAGRGNEPVSRLMRKPVFVPETKKVDRMLREMQAAKNHLAIVVDEYGGTAGLVTMEDLLEELVGEIHDEFDIAEPDIVALDGGALRVHGRMPISELNDLLDADLPDDDWDTVGGLIFSKLGHVPTVGETVDVDGFEFVVERLQGRRITRVRIAPRPDPNGAAPPEPPEGRTDVIAEAQS
ncbi:MAG TPA: hemolysin family protein [Acidimicrobiales bacterium]